jgi:ABC-type dipeptide/oligopeptide/nickel transport system permease subunit
MSAPIATEPDAVQFEPVEGVETVQGRSPRQLFWARFKQDKAAFVGLAVIILLILLAVLAPVIAGIVGHGKNELFGSTATDQFGLPKGPSRDFLMGADTAGRDVFVRVLYGAQTSLEVSI